MCFKIFNSYDIYLCFKIFNSYDIYLTLIDFCVKLLPVEVQIIIAFVNVENRFRTRK